MRNYSKVLKIAPAFLLAGTIMLEAQQRDSIKQRDIEQVVLIGYGKQKKSDLTGSVVSVTAKDFNGGSTSPEQLILGKTPGVQVTGNSGAPGAGATIRLRGGSSFINNDPLIVIDGVPIEVTGVSGASNLLASINPNDIESFDILKDASSAAIYGNRAANGVILITTKKGVAGKLKVNFTTNMSVSTKMGNLDVMTADEFRNFVNTFASDEYKSKLGTAKTNWQDLIYQEAWGTDNNLAISGGVKRLPYRLSIGYNHQNGILKTNEFKRTSLGFNVNPKFFDNHLTINAGFKGSFMDTRFANEGAIGAAQQFDPTQSVYSSDPRFGGYNEWLLNGDLNTNGTRNPLGMLYATRNISSVYRFLPSLQLDYKFHFLPDLRWNVNLAYDYAKGEGVARTAANSGIGYFNKGSYNNYENENTSKLFETYLNYVKKIGVVNVDLMAGHSYQTTTTETPAITTYNGTGQNVTSQPFSGERTLLSYYGRAIFTIANKYIVTGTIRRDGSSNFYNGTTDNLWGNFPSVALAWKINEESFLKDITSINTLKLRAGWGETGQQNVGGYYPAFARYNISSDGAQYQFGNQFYYLYRPEQNNPNLVWETMITKNIGLDFGFFNNRVNGAVDVFKKVSDNLIARVPVAAGGLSNYNVLNVGKIENEGIEVNLNVVPVKTEKATWDLNFNFSKFNPVVTYISQDVSDDYIIRTGGISGGTGNTIQGITKGQVLNAFYVYQQLYDTNGKPINGAYVDRNNDGVFNESDKYFFHSPNPDAIFGFSTKFTYGNWDLGMSMRAVLGNYVYNNAAANSSIQDIASNDYLKNGEASVLTYQFSKPEYFSDIFIEDASFLRMDNLSLGYNFGDFLGNNKSNLRVTAMAQNLFVITNYTGVDPEVFGNIDNGFYQRPKVYSLGFNFQF